MKVTLHQKLENAGTRLFCVKCKKHFFPAKGSSQDVVYFNVCVTVASVEPQSCDDSSFKLRDGRVTSHIARSFSGAVLL